MLGRLAKQVSDLQARVTRNQAAPAPPPASPAVLQLRLEAVEAALVQGISGIVQQLMACVYLQQQQQQVVVMVEEGGVAAAAEGQEQRTGSGSSRTEGQQAAEGGSAPPAASSGESGLPNNSSSPRREGGILEVPAPRSSGLQLLLTPTGVSPGAAAGTAGGVGGGAPGVPGVPLPLPVFGSLSGGAFSGEPKGAAVNAKAALAKKQQGQDQANEQQEQQQQGMASQQRRAAAAAAADALKSPRQFTPRGALVLLEESSSGSSKGSVRSGGLGQAAAVWQEVNAALQLLQATLLPGYELATSHSNQEADGAQQVSQQQQGGGMNDHTWAVGENGELQTVAGGGSQQQKKGETAGEGAGPTAAREGVAAAAAGKGQPTGTAAAVVQLQLPLLLAPGQLGWSQAQGPAAAQQRQQLRNRLQVASGRQAGKQAAGGAAGEGGKPVSPSASGGLLAVLDGHMAAGKPLQVAGAASAPKPTMLLAHKGPSQGVEAAAEAPHQ